MTNLREYMSILPRFGEHSIDVDTLVRESKFFPCGSIIVADSVNKSIKYDIVCNLRADLPCVSSDPQL